MKVLFFIASLIGFSLVANGEVTTYEYDYDFTTSVCGSEPIHFTGWGKCKVHYTSNGQLNKNSSSCTNHLKGVGTNTGSRYNYNFGSGSFSASGGTYKYSGRGTISGSELNGALRFTYGYFYNKGDFKFYKYESYCN